MNPTTLTNFSASCQRTYTLTVVCLLIWGTCGTVLTVAQPIHTFDIVLDGGRVIDPETGLDEVRNIGIRDGRIMAVSSEVLTGKQNIDVSNLVVSPGFIDLHVHGITNREQEYQARDGVTTALELEFGVPYLEKWYRSREGKALINYGASVNWAVNRVKGLDAMGPVFEEIEREISGGDFRGFPSVMNHFYRAFSVELSKIRTVEMLNGIRESLAAGGLGIGVPSGYIGGASREEVFRLYQLAGKMQVPIISHVRPGGTMAVQQAISNALLTNAPLHIVHINSVTRSEIGLAIEIVQTAQNKGFDITTELYPYPAGSTGLQTAIFDEGWQERLGISYDAIQWVATGERLTKETFDKYRKEGGMVISYTMKPEWIRLGIAAKDVMIASDGMPYAALAHPRTAGTFSRVLGKFVREEEVVTLPVALEKITLLPAKRLETVAPMMRYKGRIQVGCDADLTIFDPQTIIDKASFERGLEFSEGIRYVMVQGVLIVEDGKTVKNVFPGQPILGKYKK
ncbi:MAG: D-glutamate deacylase [Saprospiraceae bacterium]|nr:D-glutamate deacylase [Saprospiraceae bacterium]